MRFLLLIRRPGRLLAACALSLLFACQPEVPPPHYFIALDQSGSMRWNPDQKKFAGEEHLYSRSAQKLSEWAGRWPAGTQLTLYTFNGKPHLLLRATSKTQGDLKEKIAGELSRATPDGRWTNTRALLDRLYADALTARKKNENQPLIVTVLSDGLDDPPPGEARKKAARDPLKLQDLAGEPDPKVTGNKTADPDKFVYFISLSRLQSKLQTSAEGGAKTISGAGPGEALTRLENDVKQSLFERYVEPYLWLYYALAGLLALLLLYLLTRFLIRRRKRVRGHLSYWEKGFANLDRREEQLEDFKKTHVRVGQGRDNQLRIKFLDTREPIEFSMRGFFRRPRIFLSRVPAEEFKILRGVDPQTGFQLEEGARFQLANFIFEYSRDQKAEGETKKK